MFSSKKFSFFVCFCALLSKSLYLFSLSPFLFLSLSLSVSLSLSTSWCCVEQLMKIVPDKPVQQIDQVTPMPAHADGQPHSFNTDRTTPCCRSHQLPFARSCWNEREVVSDLSFPPASPFSPSLSLCLTLPTSSQTTFPFILIVARATANKARSSQSNANPIMSKPASSRRGGKHRGDLGLPFSLPSDMWDQLHGMGLVSQNTYILRTVDVNKGRCRPSRVRSNIITSSNSL